jgi:hypothetical protein
MGEQGSGGRHVGGVPRAPGYEDFSKIEPGTSPSGEWHLSGTRYEEGAWGQAIYGAGEGRRASPLWERGLWLTLAPGTAIPADLGLRRVTRVVLSTPTGGNRTPILMDCSLLCRQAACEGMQNMSECEPADLLFAAMPDVSRPPPSRNAADVVLVPRHFEARES